MPHAKRVLVAAATGLLLAACAASQEAAGPAAPRDTALGPVLADSRGMTLYILKDDPDGQSTCYDRCARAWPPLAADAAARPDGKWSVATRKDGSRQWVYGGKPLYLWDKDKRPGDVTGQGVGEVWYVARP
jgi:predicted lipoprotein with Yx(FWY)xxD motif